MQLPFLLFLAVAAAIGGAWSWLGASIPMPPSPIAAGEKLHCLSYAPFRGSQSPLVSGTYIDARQIEDDLARLAKVTECVRTYSVEHGVDQVPAIAAKYGLKVMQGIWLSSHKDKNAWQVETAIALVNRHPDVIRAVIVGNEVLLRGEMSVADLVATMQRVKVGVSVPVTYADVWEFWLRNRALAEVADFVTVHILPYWEDFPIAADKAAAHIDAIRARVAQAFPGKEILIGETGWPSEGRMRESARPSPADQARVLHDVLNAARAGNYKVNLIEAFDQPWKRAHEGTVGGYWGLYDDATRAPKFIWGQPVSNHPRWLLQAGGGIALAAFVFAAAWTGRGPTGPILRRWLSVAIIALAAGLLIGLAIEKGLTESFGISGWLRFAVMATVALTVPVIAATALARATPMPSFAQLLGGIPGRPGDILALALGGALVVLSVLAVEAALGLAFNPRYKDFPYAALGAPAVAYLAVAFAGSRPSSEGGAAERIAAAALTLSAIYIAFNEGFANWQAQSFVAVLLMLAVTLLRLAGVRKQG